MTMRDRGRFVLFGILGLGVMFTLAATFHSKALDWALVITLAVMAGATTTKRFGGAGAVGTAKMLAHIPVKRPVTTAIAVGGFGVACLINSMLLAVICVLVVPIFSREDRDAKHAADMAK